MNYQPIGLLNHQVNQLKPNTICSIDNPKPEYFEIRRIHFCLPQQEGLNKQSAKNTYVCIKGSSLTFCAVTQALLRVCDILQSIGQG